MYRTAFSVLESAVITSVVAGLFLFIATTAPVEKDPLGPAPADAQYVLDVREQATERPVAASHCVVDDKGIQRWFNEHGTLHRADGPAVVYPDGSATWFLNGKCHRDDGPAIDWKGHQVWYHHGERVELAEAELSISP